jgi:polyisoprenoid-binding protein YceI
LADIERDDNKASYRVSGDITFRGVSKRHEDVMVIHAIDDTTISLEGSSRFDIREFGMQPPRVLMLKVEPEVDIRVEIVAVKEG